MPEDLWKFFAGDLFHDAAIDGVEPNLDDHRVDILMTCPNVQVVDGDQPAAYKNVPMRATFTNVVHAEFRWKAIRDDSNGKGRKRRFRGATQFFYLAEIGTLIRPSQRGKYPDGMQSIIMQLIPGASIGLVFQDVEVHAVRRREFERAVERGLYQVAFGL
jgi:hypothetical protein